MSEQDHLAVKANMNSIKYAMAGDKDAWLALYADDAVVVTNPEVSSGPPRSPS